MAGCVDPSAGTGTCHRVATAVTNAGCATANSPDRSSSGTPFTRTRATCQSTANEGGAGIQPIAVNATTSSARSRSGLSMAAT